MTLRRFPTACSAVTQAPEIAALKISPRARNILLNMGIETLGQLRRLTRAQFMAEWRAGEHLWQQVEPYTEIAPKHVRIVRGGPYSAG